MGLGNDVKPAVLPLQPLCIPFCHRISQPVTDYSPEKTATHSHFYHRFPLCVLLGLQGMCKRQKMRAFHSCQVQKHPGRLGGTVSTCCPPVLIIQSDTPEANQARKPGDVQGHFDGGGNLGVLALQSLVATSRP